MNRTMLLVALFVTLPAANFGQDPVVQEPLKVLKSKPLTQREKDQREAQLKYVHGLACLREDKFHDALEAFEESAKLDPDSPAAFKSKMPILIALDRFSEALKASSRVLDLDPEDFSTWYVQAKLQRTLVRYPDAIASLQRGLKAKGLKDHPEAAQQMYLELGSLYEHNEKFGPAAEAYHHAAEILEHPDRIAEKAHVPIEAVKARAADTYEKIGQLYRKAKQPEKAIAALTAAQERVPDRSGRISFLLAQICEEANRPKQALGHLDVYLRTQPLGIEPYEMKVALLRRLKDTQAIVPWLEAAAGRDRFNGGLQLLYGRELAAARQTKKAEAVFTKLIDESPSAEAYRGLFNLYKDEGDAGMTRVLGMLDKVMEKAGRDDLGAVQHARGMLGAFREDGELARRLVDAAARAEKQTFTFDTFALLAALADKQRKLDEAERFYRVCFKHEQAQKNETSLYVGLLKVLLKAKKYAAAVELSQQGLKNAKATNALLFYNDLARAQAGLKRYDDALKTTDIALKQASTGELTLKMLRVRILTMAERFDAAESECQALIKTYDRPAETLELRYLLSNVYSSAKRQRDAEKQLQSILKIDPDNPTVNNDLGYLWADQNKNLAVAEDMIRKALEVDRSQRRRNPNLTPDDDKDNAAYVDSLGWVLFRRGQVEDAKKELERAVVLDGGEDPVIFDHLGDVYQRLRRTADAMEAWQRALDLYKEGVRGNEEERVRDLQRKIEEARQQVGGR